MSNPYYIPYKTPLGTAADTALKLYTLRRKFGFMERGQDLQERGLDIQERSADISAERNKLYSRQLDIQEDQTPHHLQPADPVKWSILKNGMKEAGIKAEGLGPLKMVDEMVRQGASKADVYSAISANMPRYRGEILDAIQKELDKTTAPTEHLTPKEIADRQRKAELLSGMMKQFQSDDLLDQLFPGVGEALSPVKSQTDAAMQRVITAGEYDLMKQEMANLGKTIGDWQIKEAINPQTGEPGFSLINDTTGETKWVDSVVPKPGKGMRIYDREGNLIVDTGGTGGRPVPAGQVTQLAEFKTYSDTIDQINDLINSISAGGNELPTGPFEFLNKIIDNWGIAPKSDRIKLRSLIARLPGLMYAMRGKQLSEKELEVALDMMPQMNMDDEAFLTQLATFQDYMQKIWADKTGMLKASGYSVGEWVNGQWVPSTASPPPSGGTGPSAAGGPSPTPAEPTPILGGSDEELLQQAFPNGLPGR